MLWMVVGMLLFHSSVCSASADHFLVIRISQSIKQAEAQRSERSVIDISSHRQLLFFRNRFALACRGAQIETFNHRKEKPSQSGRLNLLNWNRWVSRADDLCLIWAFESLPSGSLHLGACQCAPWGFRRLTVIDRLAPAVRRPGLIQTTMLPPGLILSGCNPSFSLCLDHFLFSSVQSAASLTVSSALHCLDHFFSLFQESFHGNRIAPIWHHCPGCSEAGLGWLCQALSDADLQVHIKLAPQWRMSGCQSRKQVFFRSYFWFRSQSSSFKATNGLCIQWQKPKT